MKKLLRRTSMRARLICPFAAEPSRLLAKMVSRAWESGREGGEINVGAAYTAILGRLAMMIRNQRMASLVGVGIVSMERKDGYSWSRYYFPRNSDTFAAV